MNTNAYICAKLSKSVYDNEVGVTERGKSDIPQGWEHIASSGSKDDPEGFFAAAFRKGNEAAISAL